MTSPPDESPNEVAALRARVAELEAELAASAGTRRELALSEERFRLAFQTSPDAISLTRASDGQIVDMNEGLTAITGWSRDEAVGRTSVELGMWVDAEARDEMRRAILEQGECLNLETRFRRRDGTLLHGLFSARAIMLDGEVHLLSVARDITELREAEEERASLQDRLARAERLQMVGRLASGVAHDFNNMLTVICGFTGLLSQSLEGDARAEDVAQIEATAMRAAELTRQLLAYGRRQVLTPESHASDTILGDIAVLLRGAMPPGIELHLALDEALWPVFVDRTQLERVVTNLVVNARDAMPDGGRITLRARNDRRDGSEHVLIEVEDEGVGMDPETVEHIFDPFFTTKGPERGSGLGLSSVEGIVRQSGGAIEVRSEPGQGTTFSVWMPRAPEEPVVVADEPAKAAAEVAGGCLLVVDDDPGVRRLLERSLSAAGYQPLVAADGPSLLEALDTLEAAPRALVTDVVMPGMAGPEVARRVRRRWPGLPVLYVTGFADLDTIDTIRRSERSRLLRKMFTPDQLVDALEELLLSTSDARPARNCG